MALSAVACIVARTREAEFDTEIAVRFIVISNSLANAREHSFFLNANRMVLWKIVAFSMCLWHKTMGYMLPILSHILSWNSQHWLSSSANQTIPINHIDKMVWPALKLQLLVNHIYWKMVLNTNRMQNDSFAFPDRWQRAKPTCRNIQPDQIPIYDSSRLGFLYT